MKRITIKTIAEQLGLSIATVSRALQNSHEISATTREKVKQAANDLGYSPNVYASGLRAGSSKTIAVIVPEVENHFSRRSSVVWKASHGKTIIMY